MKKWLVIKEHEGNIFGINLYNRKAQIDEVIDYFKEEVKEFLGSGWGIQNETVGDSEIYLGDYEDNLDVFPVIVPAYKLTIVEVDF